MSCSEPCPDNDFLCEHAMLLLSSYRRLTGTELVAAPGSDAERARRLFEAPFAVVSHNTAADPVFNYGNRTALRIFEMDWAAFTALPSRKSAEPVNRDERAALLAAVTENGFVDDYRGVRISATGTRFVIEDATIWNVIDAQGQYRGQAAVLRRWFAQADA